MISVAGAVAGIVDTALELPILPRFTRIGPPPRVRFGLGELDVLLIADEVAPAFVAAAGPGGTPLHLTGRM